MSPQFLVQLFLKSDSVQISLVISPQNQLQTVLKVHWITLNTEESTGNTLVTQDPSCLGLCTPSFYNTVDSLGYSFAYISNTQNNVQNNMPSYLFAT